MELNTTEVNDLIDLIFKLYDPDGSQKLDVQELKEMLSELLKKKGIMELTTKDVCLFITNLKNSLEAVKKKELIQNGKKPSPNPKNQPSLTSLSEVDKKKMNKFESQKTLDHLKFAENKLVLQRYDSSTCTGRLRNFFSDLFSTYTLNNLNLTL